MKKKDGQPTQRTHPSSIPIAREVLEREASAIANLAPLLDENFDAAVSLICELIDIRGRLIVLGMGKAGIIAQKISATFSSVGISSFFLHPAEAIHGDLGRFVNHDVALIFSNLGETPEILRILPSIKRIGCSIIAITSHERSSLAQHSDVVLRIGSLTEADPHGLAPTTSTTAMLALGDALAIAVVQRIGFTREQFALYHPGGSLGRQLMKVRDIMRTGAAHCIVAGSLTTREVIHKIAVTEGRPGAASILADDGTLGGIFTDGDLRRLLDEEKGDFLSRPIREVMTKNPKVAHPDQLATEALRTLAEYHIDQLVVVDDKTIPVGLVDIQDLIDLRDLSNGR